MSFAKFFISFFCFFLLSGEVLAQDKEELDRSKVCQSLHPFMGEIGDSTYKDAHEITSLCLRNPVNTSVSISSPGGKFGSGVAIFDTFKNSPGATKLTTVAQGVVGSAAVLIFLSGHERHISCNAVLMIHHPIITLERGTFKGLEISQVDKVMQDARETQVRLYAEVTGLNAEKVSKLLDSEQLLSADEAVRLGFATKKIGYCAK